VGRRRPAALRPALRRDTRHVRVRGCREDGEATDYADFRRFREEKDGGRKETSARSSFCLPLALLLYLRNLCQSAKSVACCSWLCLRDQLRQTNPIRAGVIDRTPGPGLQPWASAPNKPNLPRGNLKDKCCADNELRKIRPAKGRQKTKPICERAGSDRAWERGQGSCTNKANSVGWAMSGTLVVRGIVGRSRGRMCETNPIGAVRARRGRAL
jgi:hypothetical protein